jgi:protein-tyrosine phosphatase
MLEVLEQALRFIQEGINEGGKVLIHCMLGVSRAATLAVAYVMRERQVPVEEALAVIGRRKRVFPNQSFLQQLLWFHEHNYAVDKHTPDYRALKARYTTHAQITEQLP